MVEPLRTAEFYFELSNKSDFDGIAELLTETTTYSSQNTGIYLGRDNIIAMQKTFHGGFSSLRWNINSAEETKPGVVLVDFEFTGTKLTGEKIQSLGLEYVIAHQNKIQHLEVRNKN